MLELFNSLFLQPCCYFLTKRHFIVNIYISMSIYSWMPLVPYDLYTDEAHFSVSTISIIILIPLK